MNGNVAIVSLNKELIRFFELEIKSMDCNVTSFSQESGVSDKYDIIIVDKDTVNNINGSYHCPVIIVSSELNGAADMYSLPWPTPISLIRDTCKYYIYNSEDEQGKDKGKDRSLNSVYVLDRESGTVIIDNCRVKLTNAEFVILEMLCLAKGETVSREKIMERLGAQDGNISDVYICHLRKKIEAPLGKRLIFTERHKGYKTVLEINR